MKLPWQKKIEEKEEEIEMLEEKLEELEDDRDSWKERFRAEEERRKELSRKKQEAEEKLNRLGKKLEGSKKEEIDEQEQGKNNTEREEAEFDQVYNLLKKLETVKSPEDDLLTVYSPGKIQDIPDQQSLKNSVSREKFEEMKQRESFTAFLDNDFIGFLLKTVPFYSPEFSVNDGFRPDKLIDFIESEKLWVLVSAGDTRIYREGSGEYEEVEIISSRVDRQHSKGGFSQGRFEKKRDEQIENHLEEVEEKLEDLEGKIYLLGDKRFCSDLPGEYLGGFDPNRQKPGQFYGFRMLKL